MLNANKNENKDKNIVALIIQFIKFGIVGLSNTFVSLVIYYIFVFINEDLFILGNTVGWVISVANAFYWSNKYVFKNENRDRKALLKALLKTYISYGFTFVLSTVLLYCEVNFWGISQLIAAPINMIITIPINFIVNKFWAYKDN